MTKVTVFHGTHKIFNRFDKRQPGASSPGLCLGLDSHCFTDRLETAEGYAGESATANVRTHEVDVTGAMVIDCEGLPYKDTHETIVKAISERWPAEKLWSHLVRDFWYRMREIYCNEPLAGVRLWIGTRKLHREQSPGRQQGRRFTPGFRLHLEKIKRVYRRAMAVYDSAIDVVVFQNSGDKPLGPDWNRVYTPEYHTVTVVLGTERISEPLRVRYYVEEE